MVAEKLASLEAIADKKSALAASNAGNAIRAAAFNAGNAVRAAAFYSADAVRAAAFYAAYDAVRAAADAAADAAGHAANTAAAYDAANAVEMEFLNAELERRLLALMGLTETEVIQ